MSIPELAHRVFESMRANRTPAPPAITIREATPADTDDIVRLALDFIQQTDYREKISHDHTSMRRVVSRLLGSKVRVLLAMRGDAAVGVLAFTVYEHPWTEELTAAEIMWWVEPDARGRTGLRLLRQAEDIAKDASAKGFELSAWNKNLEQMYSALGYARTDCLFRKEF